MSAVSREVESGIAADVVSGVTVPAGAPPFADPRERHQAQVVERSPRARHQMLGWAALSLLPPRWLVRRFEEGPASLLFEDGLVPLGQLRLVVLDYLRGLGSGKLPRGQTRPPGEVLQVLLRGYSGRRREDGLVEVGGSTPEGSLFAYDLRFRPVPDPTVGGKILGLHQAPLVQQALDMDLACWEVAHGRQGVAPREDTGIAASMVEWVEKLRWPHLLAGFEHVPGNSSLPPAVATPAVQALVLEVARSGLLPAWPAPVAGRSRYLLACRAPGDPSSRGHVLQSTFPGVTSVLMPNGCWGQTPVTVLTFRGENGAILDPLEVPPAAVLLPGTRPGTRFLPGAPVADFVGRRHYRSWEELAEVLGPVVLQWLVNQVVTALDERRSVDEAGRSRTLRFRRLDFLTAVPSQAPVWADCRAWLLPGTLEGRDRSGRIVERRIWRPQIQVVRGESAQVLVAEGPGHRFDAFQCRPNWFERFHRHDGEWS